MSLHHATIRQFRGFEATARTGSITAAANELGLTPSAVSLQMKQLEELAGMALLERGAEGFRPTEAGRELLHAAAFIELAIADCDERLNALRGIESGTVRVGVVSTAKYFAPRALAAFLKEHPTVELQLVVGNRGETIEALTGLQVDFAVMGRPPRDEDVEQAIIGPHPHVIIAPPDHPLAGRRAIATEDLAAETFLLREPGSGTRLLMERLLATAGVRPRTGAELGSNETIKQAVMAGLGIALISAHTVSTEVADKRLAVLDVVGLPIIRQWYVVRLAEKRLLPAAQAMWDFLAASGADFLPRYETGEAE
jgi:LysR family transcriptional regulator for metE and metH